MRLFPSKWSWLAMTALSLGVVVVGSKGSQAWQNSKTQRAFEDEGDAESQTQRGPGWLLLNKCHIKLVNSVVLGSDRPGVIAYMEPKEGDEVRAQQKIVGMLDGGAQAALKIAQQKAENEVQIKFAKVSAEVAKAEYDKNVEANKQVKGTVTFVELERARLNWQKAVLQGENAEFEQKVAKLEVEKATEDLKTFHIEAPFDGVVRKILKQKGEPVSQGTPILELISTRTVKVEGYVPIEDLWSVKKGDVVEVQIDIPNRDLEIEKEVFEGKVVFVDRTVSPVTAGARVSAEVINTGDRLIEGLYAKMKIKHGQRGTAKGADARPANGIKQTGGTRVLP